MGGGVDDNLRMIGREHPLQRLPVGDGADFQLQIQLAAIGDFQLLLNVVGPVFINIQNDDLLRLHFRQLAAQLRADGAAASRNQNHLVPVEGTGFLIGDDNGLAEEQLFNVKVPDIPLAPGGLHHRIVVDLDFVARVGIGGVKLPLLLIGQVGDGEYHLLHLVAAQGIQGSIVLQQHRQAVDFPSRLFLAHIDEAPGQEIGGGIGQQLLGQGHPHPSRADDGDFDFVLRLPVGMDQLVPGENPQQQSQKLAVGGICRAAFEAVAIDHPDSQSSQKVHAGNAQKPGEGHFLDRDEQRQRQLNGQGRREGHRVHQQQPDVALNAAVAPDLLVDAAQNPGGKDAHEADAAVHQAGTQGQLLVASVEHQQQQIHRQQNQQVIQGQLPAEIAFFHVLSPYPAALLTGQVSSS